MDIQSNLKKLPPPRSIRITFPKHIGECIVTWDPIVVTDASIKNISYNIYRGISSNGIFYKLNTSPLLNNRYDDKMLLKNPNTVYWYKISTLYEDLTGKIIEGGLSSPESYKVTNTDKWFKKINERNMWILKNTGQLFDLYTRKYEGNICTKCYDTIRGRSGDNACNVCFGTGFEGGFEPMFQLYVRLKPSETSLDQATEEYVYTNFPGAWLISKVEIKNRDILISPQGKLYSVLNYHINQVSRYLFHQQLKLKELDPTDQLYRLERTTLYPFY